MIKKALVVAGGLVALALLANWLVHTLATHETRIHWLLEEMENAFNSGSARQIARGLAEDFRAEEGGFDRRQTVVFFTHFVVQNRDREGEFLYRCEIPGMKTPDAGALVIRVDEERSPPTATVTVMVRVLRHAANSTGAEAAAMERHVGTLEFDGELIVEEGAWRFRRARQRLLEGKRPF